MNNIKKIVVLLMMMGLAGCPNKYPGLFFVEHIQFGFEGSINTTDTRPVNVNLGYDRAMFAVAPKNTPGEDSVSMLSKTDLLIQFTDESVISGVFASGDVANSLTESSEKLDALFGICRQTPEMAGRKQKIAAALDSLDSDPDKSQKITALYKKIFPGEPLGDTFDWTEGAQCKYQAEKLKDKLFGICDPVSDLNMLSLFETELRIDTTGSGT